MGRTDGERVRLKWYSMYIRISPLLGMLLSQESCLLSGKAVAFTDRECYRLSLG